MTAIEYLVQQIFGEHTEAWQKKIQQALEMEKQQHGETWNAAIQAHENRGFVISRSLCDFDNYFDELKTANK